MPSNDVPSNDEPASSHDSYPPFLGCADWKHTFLNALGDTPVRWVLDRRTMHIEVLHVRDVENGIWFDGTGHEISDLEHNTNER